MSPEDPYAELAAAREKRLTELERRVSNLESVEVPAVQEGNRKLAETQGQQHERIGALVKSVDALWKAVETIRTELRANTMVLVGFAFTVAAAAVALALTLGKH